MIDHRIQTFILLYETMNYREAAARLHMTQPAVTQHIQYLEREYGCRLFLYDGRRLRRTAEAEILKSYADTSVYRERKLLQALHPRCGVQLRIGATKTIGEYAIYEHVQRFLKEPENQLTLEVDNTAEILRLLREGRVDFALVEGFFPRTEFGYRLYRKEQFTGVCGVHHPFAGKTVALEALWREHLICREKNSGTRAIMEQLLMEQNHTIADFARVTSIGNFGLLSRLVADHQGITFTYNAVCEGHPGLERFSVEGWDTVREFDYVYLCDTEAEEAVGVFEGYR